MTPGLKGIGLRLLVAAALLAATLAVYGYRDLYQPAALQALLANNPWAPLGFIAVHTLASLFFVPRTLLCAAAGLIFGLWWGIALATLGTMAGAIACFWLVRLVNGGLINIERLPKLGGIIAQMERGGWFTVLLIRLMPLPATALNYAFGLTEISFGAYCLGTLIGSLPSTLVATDLGAAGADALSGGGHWLGPALVLAAAIGLMLMLRKLRRAE